MFSLRSKEATLRYRVMISVLVVAVVIIGLAGTVHGLLLEHMARNFLHQRLASEADYIASQVGSSLKQGAKGERPTDGIKPDAHHIYAVFANGKPLEERDRWNQALRPALNGPLNQLQELSENGRELFAYRRQLDLGNGDLELVVAENVRNLNRDIRALHWWVAGVSFFLLVVLILLLVVAIGLAFKPLVRLRGQLDAIRHGARERLEPQGAREVDELANQINLLMDTLDQRLTRSRSALANLSHSLKTPLSALLGFLESDEPIDPQTRHLLVDRLRGVHDQVEDELRRARLAGPAFGAQCHPLAQTRDLIKLCRQLYPDKQVDWDTDLEDEVPVPIEQQDFNELLGNVVDNACKWAAKRVCVMLASAEGGLRLVVEDDGPGVPEDQLRQLGQRGLRLDEQVPGHGLGLAIVTELLQRYRGHIELTRARMGGLRVVLNLPSEVAD